MSSTFDHNGAANNVDLKPSSGGAIAAVNYAATTVGTQLIIRVAETTFDYNDADQGAAIFSGAGSATVLASKLALIDSSFTGNRFGNVMNTYGFTPPPVRLPFVARRQCPSPFVISALTFVD